MMPAKAGTVEAQTVRASRAAGGGSAVRVRALRPLKLGDSHGRLAEGPSVPAAASQVSSDSVRALRHAREIVDDLRWLGMTVPPLYASMAEEFQALVRSGAYATWVATSQRVTR
jgi:hypothetical protein